MAKKTRAQKASIDLRMLGPEPEPFVITDSRDSRLAAALRWYGYFYTVDDAKSWLLKYAKANRSKDTYRRIKEAPNWKTSMTAGILAHLIDRGFEIPAESYQFLDQKIEENIRVTDIEADEPDVTVPMKARLNPHARLLRKVEGQLDELEGKIDDFMDGKEDFSFYTWATAEGVSPLLISKVKDKFQRFVHEMETYPEDFKSAYSKRAKQLYLNIIDDANRLASNKKTVRKPRKSAAPSREKAVKWLKFKEKDDSLKLVSIAPTNIIGSKELWVFNTKNKQLGVYRAATDMGLGVKGTSITGYDEKKSVYKKLRKPEEVLQSFFTGKPTKVFADVKAMEHEIGHRVNKETILLKVAM